MQPQIPSFALERVKECWNKQTSGSEHHGKNWISRCLVTSGGSPSSWLVATYKIKGL